ncbi:hypothetical protein ABPG74_016938 [Tetrahymena malaccensis]
MVLANLAQDLVGGSIKQGNIFEKLLEEQFIRQVKYYNDSIWYYYSLATIIPLATFFIYRLFFPKDFSQSVTKNEIKPDIWDRIVQIFIFYGPVYYVFDLYVYIALGDYGVCFFAYTLHHITSLVFLPSLIYLNYYNWWQLSVPLFHACLFYFKDNFLIEVCYLLSVVLFHYGVRSRVCRDLPRFKLAHKALFFIYTAIITMFFGQCRDM